MPLTPPPARGKPQSYYIWESVVRRVNGNNMQLIQQNLRLTQFLVLKDAISEL